MRIENKMPKSMILKLLGFIFPELKCVLPGFSLNGELMMDASGSETAFNEVQGDAFVPACTLGVGQRAHLIFGQDINQLKFFTTYGLQEGYEPFCVYVKFCSVSHHSKI